MGCDIHIFAEVKNKETNKWEKVGNVFKSCFDHVKELQDEPYEGRNYDLFAILADVRNGRGFAGVKTSEGFNPISEPRGLPEDVSNDVNERSESWDSDGHSHSYFTVQELLDYDWNQITMKRGYISLQQYNVLKESGEKWPDSWSGGVAGHNIVCIDEHEVEGYQFENDKKYYINYHWTITYKESADFFHDTTIPTLLQLGSPNNVRIVFWFDN
jgi:hypothetical protein